MNRYEGRPFLFLLDCYVMWAADELPADECRKLDVMLPRLRQVYGDAGSWQEIVVREMELPADMHLTIRELWEKNKSAANLVGSEIGIAEFVNAFVEQNFDIR